MKRAMLFIFMISLLSGCHFMTEMEHENVIKIPKSMDKLNKKDTALGKSDVKLQRNSNRLKKRTVVLQRNDKLLAKEITHLKGAVKEIKGKMQKQIEAQQVEIEQLSETQVKLTLQDQVVFKKRSIQIARSGRHLLNDFAKAVKNVSSPIHIRIVGHTDDLPIDKFERKEFLDNWELSADRAAAVARYLIWAGKLDPSIMHIEGRSNTQPLVANDSAKNRAQNRRVELYLENSEGAAMELNAAPTTANNPCSVVKNPCAAVKNPCGVQPEVTPVM